jgi:uncharacterized membrane protein
METGKNTAIISYLTFLGVIIAIFMNLEDKKPLASFHIRQSLGLYCLFFLIGYIVSHFENLMIHFSFLTSFFLLWIYGFFSAINGSVSPIPLLGNLFQKFFKSIS